MTNLVLPTMRAQHFGRIVNISSIGGNVYSPLGAHYYATKAALQQWSDSLDLEIAQFGVRSVIVQPGGTQSSWSDIAIANAKKNMTADSPYRPMIGALGAIDSSSRFSNGATSKDLAVDFYKAATDLKPKLRYFHSLGDRMMVRVAKSHPRVYRAALRQIVKRLGQR